MAQEFTIRDIKKTGTWKNSYGEYQSYGMALEGVGEPVKLNKLIPVQDEPKKGDLLYGGLVLEKAKDGREYYRFKSEARPEADERQVSIQSQFAVRLAAEVWIAQGCQPDAYANIEAEAKHFYKMINKIRE